jgi:hypothetical protein
MVFSFGSKSSKRLIFQSVPLESKSEETWTWMSQVFFYLTNQMPSQHRYNLEECRVVLYFYEEPPIPVLKSKLEWFKF